MNRTSAKLLLGRQWASLRGTAMDTSKWDAFLQRMHDSGVITKAHWDFVQGVWDLLEETKPLAQATHRRVFGRFFDEVAADPVTTPFGTYRGATCRRRPMRGRRPMQPFARWWKTRTRR